MIAADARADPCDQGLTPARDPWKGLAVRQGGSRAAVHGPDETTFRAAEGFELPLHRRLCGAEAVGEEIDFCAAAPDQPGPVGQDGLEDEVGIPGGRAHEGDLFRSLDEAKPLDGVADHEAVDEFAATLEKPGLEGIHDEPPRAARADHVADRMIEPWKFRVESDVPDPVLLGMLFLEQRHEQARIAVRRDQEPDRTLIGGVEESGRIDHIVGIEQQDRIGVEPPRLAGDAGDLLPVEALGQRVDLGHDVVLPFSRSARNVIWAPVRGHQAAPARCRRSMAPAMRSEACWSRSVGCRVVMRRWLLQFSPKAVPGKMRTPASFRRR